MAYVKASFRTIKGKRYGPYLEQRESYREGDQVKTNHIAYMGAGIAMAGAPGISKSDKPSFYKFMTKQLNDKVKTVNDWGQDKNQIDFGAEEQLVDTDKFIGRRLVETIQMILVVGL